MIYTGLNHTGEVQVIHTHGGGTVEAVYGGINYQDPIFYSRKTLVGASPLTFKGLGQPLKDYHIFGETIQDGTPSPDYPVDVQGCGEKTENLFDKDSPDVVRHRSFDQSGNIIDNGWSAITGYIPIKPDTFYSMFPKNGAYGWYGVFYDSEKNQISTFNVSGGGDGTSGQYIYKSPGNAAYARLSVLNTEYYARTMYVEGTEELVLSNIIPYGYKTPVTIGNTTTPIYIGSDPLYRIGEYADEIDFANQRIVRRVKKLVLNGTENWAQINSTTIFWIVTPSQKNWGAYNVCVAANGYKAVKSIYGAVDPDKLKENEISCRLNATYINDPRYTTVESFKDYLAARHSSGNPIILYYPFNTPTISTITVPQLTAASGDNTLSVDTAIKPSAVSITGNIKPTGYGQLFDANDVDIQDKNNEPVFIQG